MGDVPLREFLEAELSHLRKGIARERRLHDKLEERLARVERIMPFVTLAALVLGGAAGTITALVFVRIFGLH